MVYDDKIDVLKYSVPTKGSYTVYFNHKYVECLDNSIEHKIDTDTNICERCGLDLKNLMIFLPEAKRS